MHPVPALFLSILFCSLRLVAAAEPAPLPPREAERLKHRLLQERQLGDLSFCYGDNSICEFSNNLFSECENYQEPYQPVKWYQCICGNGYVSVNEACFWCQVAYNLDLLYSGSSDKEGCSSVGVPIAPIPSSILAVESSYNQTYTGIISGAGQANTGSPVSAAASTTESSPQTVTSAHSSQAVLTPSTRSSQASRTPNTASLGSTSIVTLIGGGAGFTSAAPTSTPSPTTTPTSVANAGSGSGAERQRGTALIVVFLVVALSLSALCLL